MKKMAAFVLLLSCFCISNAQMDIGAISDSLVKEGKTLYKSEMASWNGTDIFLGKYKNRENVGGYFSYSIGDTSRCIFFSKGLSPTVIGCIYFDETFDVNKAIVDLSERVFTKNEEDLFIIRKTALTEINTDTLFKSYNNANLNLIPLISGGEKMVYVLTGPTVNGVIIFGNDYLLKFNEENKVILKKQLHRNILNMKYEINGEQIQIASIHSHAPETGDFITATDICTLMLYEKFAKWNQHYVISKNYVSIWDCNKDILTILTREAWDKINQHQKGRKKSD